MYTKPLDKATYLTNMDRKPLLIKAATIAENKKNSPKILSAVSIPVENQSGFVFGLWSFNYQQPLAEGIKKILIDGLSHLVQLLSAKNSPAYNFEKALEIINQSISEQMNNYPEISPGTKNMALIGLAIDKTIYLSGWGNNITAAFLHRLPDQHYRIFNLARSLQTEQPTTNWSKIFSVILDGDIKAGDVFYASNIPIHEEIETNDLNALLINLPPQSATMKIRQYFPLDIDLTLLVLKIDEETSGPPVSAPASLQQLHRTHETTKQILSDQRPKIFNNFLTKILSSIKNYRQYRKSLRLLSRVIIAAVWLAIKLIFGLLKGIIKTGQRLSSSPERSNLFKEIKIGLNQGTKFTIGGIKRLPKTSRYLILAALTTVLVLVIGIILVSQIHIRNQEQQTFNTTIEKVSSLRDKASGAIIYKNEIQAKNFLKEAQTLLATMNDKTSDNKNKINSLQAELDKISNSLKKNSEVNPELLASASSLPSPATLSALALVNNELYSLGNNKVIYRVNKNNKTFETSTTNESAVSGKEASVEGLFVAWLDERPGLDIYDQANNQLVATSATPTSNEHWVDLYAYADRVYVLAPGNGLTSQIYRFSRNGTGLGGASAWLKSPTVSLSDAVSLAVDGTVFVLKQDGKIIRLVGGQEVGWNQSSVDPILTSASDIWTSADSQYIYVLDPAGQRLVVYEKDNGNLKIQYHSPNLTGLTDFAVDEINKTIYLLGNGGIYKIAAEHLK
jgi:hypothetical protein